MSSMFPAYPMFLACSMFLAHPHTSVDDIIQPRLGVLLGSQYRGSNIGFLSSQSDWNFIFPIFNPHLLFFTKFIIIPPPAVGMNDDGSSPVVFVLVMLYGSDVYRRIYEDEGGVRGIEEAGGRDFIITIIDMTSRLRQRRLIDSNSNQKQ